MNIFKNRPLLLALFIFSFFEILCVTLNTRFRFACMWIFVSLFTTLLLATIALAAIKFSHIRIFTTSLLCAFFAAVACISSYKFFDVKLSYIESLEDEENVIAEIKECTYSSNYSMVYTAKIESINGNKTNFNAELSTSSDMILERGQRISASMSFAPFSEEIYGYDERNSMISSGILTSAYFEDADVLADGSGFNLLTFIADIRAKLGKVIDKNFDKTAPVIKALLIGDKSDLDASTKQDFRRLGISHILAISGTHFTVLLGMITLLLSIVGLDKRKVYVILIPIALLYMGLSGFSLSVCRAGIMAILSFWGFLSGRTRDSYTALFVALATILIIAPYSISSISLWLSFTATLTILIIIDVCGARIFSADRPWYKKIFYYVISHLLITACISFSTLPIVTIYYGYISKATLLANLFVVPLFELFLYIIPFAVALSNFSFAVVITEIYGGWLLSFVKYLASADNLLLYVNYGFVTIISCIGIAATLILLAVPLKKKFIIAIPAIVSVVSIAVGITIASSLHARNTYVSYFTYNKSDGIVITDNNSTMYIDITNGSSQPSYIAQYITSQNHCAEISAYVFTHYRSSHADTLNKLSNRTRIQTVYLPIAKTGTSAEYMSKVANVAKEHGIDIVYFDYGYTWEFEGCTVTVFEPQFLKRSTHEVVSLNISAKDNDVLYLGSSFSETEVDYSVAASDAEYIFFGQHYPKAKCKFNLTTSATLIYGNEDIYELSDINSPAYVLKNGARYDFVLKNAT